MPSGSSASTGPAHPNRDVASRKTFTFMTPPEHKIPGHPSLECPLWRCHAKAISRLLFARIGAVFYGQRLSFFENHRARPMLNRIVTRAFLILPLAGIFGPCFAPALLTRPLAGILGLAPAEAAGVSYKDGDYTGPTAIEWGTITIKVTIQG